MSLRWTTFFQIDSDLYDSKAVDEDDKLFCYLHRPTAKGIVMRKLKPGHKHNDPTSTLRNTDTFDFIDLPTTDIETAKQTAAAMYQLERSNKNG